MKSLISFASTFGSRDITVDIGTCNLEEFGGGVFLFLFVCLLITPGKEKGKGNDRGRDGEGGEGGKRKVER